MKIQNLIPKKSSFRLSAIDADIELLPCTARRMVKMAEVLGGEIEQMLAMPNADNVSKMAIMLMAPESMEHFKKQKVTLIDLEGNIEESEIGGAALLMNLIYGVSEQFSIYIAILESLGWPKEKAEDQAQRYIDAVNGIVEKKIEDSKKKEEP